MYYTLAVYTRSASRLGQRGDAGHGLGRDGDGFSSGGSLEGIVHACYVLALAMQLKARCTQVMTREVEKVQNFSAAAVPQPSPALPNPPATMPTPSPALPNTPAMPAPSNLQASPEEPPAVDPPKQDAVPTSAAARTKLVLQRGAEKVRAEKAAKQAKAAQEAAAPVATPARNPGLVPSVERVIGSEEEVERVAKLLRDDVSVASDTLHYSFEEDDSEAEMLDEPTHDQDLGDAMHGKDGGDAPHHGDVHMGAAIHNQVPGDALQGKDLGDATHHGDVQLNVSGDHHGDMGNACMDERASVSVSIRDTSEEIESDNDFPSSQDIREAELKVNEMLERPASWGQEPDEYLQPGVHQTKPHVKKKARKGKKGKGKRRKAVALPEPEEEEPAPKRRRAAKPKPSSKPKSKASCKAKAKPLPRSRKAKPGPKPKSSPAAKTKAKAKPGPKAAAKVKKTSTKPAASKSPASYRSPCLKEDAYKQKQSRKSSAYHCALKKARRDGLPDDECRSLAREASRLQSIPCTALLT